MSTDGQAEDEIREGLDLWFGHADDLPYVNRMAARMPYKPFVERHDIPAGFPRRRRVRAEYVRRIGSCEIGKELEFTLDLEGEPVVVGTDADGREFA